jgi:hypothetical protein
VFSSTTHLFQRKRETSIIAGKDAITALTQHFQRLDVRAALVGMDADALGVVIIDGDEHRLEVGFGQTLSCVAMALRIMTHPGPEAQARPVCLTSRELHIRCGRSQCHETRSNVIA